MNKRARVPHINRRDFMTLAGSAAATAWPQLGRAQDKRMHTVGILMPFQKTDAAIQARTTVFKQALAKLGWVEGANITFVERWPGDNMDLVRSDAASLVAIDPDAILMSGDRVTPVLMKLTSTIPIVIAGTSDPIATGAAESLARPGRNATGFSLIELSMIGKLIEIVKQIAPNMSRVGMIYNPDNPVAVTYQKWFETSAAKLGVQPVALPLHDVAEIERSITGFAAEPIGGIISPPDLTAIAHRKLIVDLAARHKLPAIYTNPLFAQAGGLAVYGADTADTFPKAAGYVDRILRGEKAGELPFQQPTVFRFILNLKAAAAIGVTVPSTLLALADEVIE
jgi:putative tryptophan/tyrosine transport system substrate-binding protein